MITLSEFLNTIPFPDNAYKSALVAIREAKRLEALDVPRVETERKPIVDDEGDTICLIVDDKGIYIDWELSQQNAESNARNLTKATGQPHTVYQVMAPESGECPTIPVMTYTPTPERPHEWVIYNANGRYESRWFAIAAGGVKYWASLLTNKEAKRFATAAEAHTYIDEHNIDGAYPWPIPKLTTAN